MLASRSPRRRDLLAQLGIEFDAVSPDVDETPRPGERALDLVRRLAVTKARAVAGEPVLAADTIVEVDGEALGQPVDADDARRMLRRLSGRTHRVHTGVALRTGGHEDVETVTTFVTFTPITPPPSSGTSAPASRSTRPAPTPSKAPAACSSTASGGASATWSVCPWRRWRRCCAGTGSGLRPLALSGRRLLTALAGAVRLAVASAEC